MLMNKLLGKVALCTATLAMVCPTNIVSASDIAPMKQLSTSVSDVCLYDGVLTGQVINEAGLASLNTVVSIQQGGREIVRTQTDLDGVFKVHGLKNGIYTVVTATSTNQIRSWENNIAPPGANQIVTIITGNTTRGQFLAGTGMLNAVLVGLGATVTTAGVISVSSNNKNEEETMDPTPTSSDSAPPPTPMSP